MASGDLLVGLWKAGARAAGDLSDGVGQVLFAIVAGLLVAQRLPDVPTEIEGAWDGLNAESRFLASRLIRWQLNGWPRSTRRSSSHLGILRGRVDGAAGDCPEGVRLKHLVNGNSIKMYDKEGQLLRVETTIVNPREFRVYRASETNPDGKNKWLRMRSGTADLWRRAEVSRASNTRYLSALASVTDQTPLKELARPACRVLTVDGQRFRALNPWAEDAPLLEIISRGEFALNGLRNRDVRRELYPKTDDRDEQRRRSAAVTRKLALLRAHDLMKKVSGTHRWVLTDNGRRVVTTLLAAREANVDQLTQLAA